MESLLYFSLTLGLIVGFYYGFMALGLNLIFGTMKIVNLAHGDFIMLAALTTYYLGMIFRIPVWLMLAAVVPIYFVVGLALYFGLVRKIRKSSDSEMTSLVVFFGVSTAIESGASLLFGTTPRSIPLITLPDRFIVLFGFSTSTVYIVIAAVSIALTVLTFSYLYLTRYGKATRAVIYSPEVTSSLGINSGLISMITFSFSIALTAVAGVMSPYVFGSIVPSEGGLITIIAFTIVVIGALGNPLGATIGGIIYGIVFSISEQFEPSWTYAIIFAVMILIMLVRPSGLFGRVEREA